eukprot:NODE_243_length_11887_cov_0.520699.p13 type:complete len:127 gc:universal NODE_243_length_11887_cov_0.520699:1068-688(-)
MGLKYAKCVANEFPADYKAIKSGDQQSWIDYAANGETECADSRGLAHNCVSDEIRLQSRETFGSKISRGGVCQKVECGKIAGEKDSTNCSNPSFPYCTLYKGLKVGLCRDIKNDCDKNYSLSGTCK